MGAAAARPVSLAVEMVPVADAACRPVAQACFAMARMTVHNTSARPVLLDWYFVELSREGKSGYHGIFPSASLDPGTTIEIRDVEFELHTEAVHTLRVAYHLDGERPGSRGHVSSGRWLWLQDAALAACKRCNGGKEEQCACETGDRCPDVCVVCECIRDQPVEDGVIVQPPPIVGHRSERLQRRRVGGDEWTCGSRCRRRPGIFRTGAARREGERQCNARKVLHLDFPHSAGSSVSCSSAGRPPRRFSLSPSVRVAT